MYVLRLWSLPNEPPIAREGLAADAVITLAGGGALVMGAYLQWADPDAEDGDGAERWTNNLAKAKKFASFDDAVAYWRRQSTVTPLRRDGRPNRPLTAYNVTIEKV